MRVWGNFAQNILGLWRFFWNFFRFATFFFLEILMFLWYFIFEIPFNFETLLSLKYFINLDMNLPQKTSDSGNNLLLNTSGSGSNLLQNTSHSGSNILQNTSRSGSNLLWNYFCLVNFFMFFFCFFFQADQKDRLKNKQKHQRMPL